MGSSYTYFCFCFSLLLAALAVLELAIASFRSPLTCTVTIYNFEEWVYDYVVPVISYSSECNQETSFLCSFICSRLQPCLSKFLSSLHTHTRLLAEMLTQTGGVKWTTVWSWDPGRPVSPIGDQTKPRRLRSTARFISLLVVPSKLALASRLGCHTSALAVQGRLLSQMVLYCIIYSCRYTFDTDEVSISPAIFSWTIVWNHLLGHRLQNAGCRLCHAHMSPKKGYHAEAL